ncbi:HAMP domain-containing histidine kinase [Candidatus Woesearchaeota archaeon]|nr:HAMP domain-containing histidine kinase [Candidatus Woesearchaeota archaeon]
MFDFYVANRNSKVFIQLSRIYWQLQLKGHATNLERAVNKRTKELIKSKSEYKKKASEADKASQATLNILEDVEEARQKIKTSNKKLKELDKLKTDFLSFVSHELRTPVTPIRSQLQRLLSKSLSKTERQRSLQMVLRNTDRLDRLINDILEISRIKSKRLKIHQRKTDISSLVKQASHTFDSLAKENNLKLIVTVPKRNIIAYVDTDRIKEVIVNLIDNAIKHSQAKKIEISLKKTSNELIFCVQDDGKGISQDEQKKIFKTFYVGIEKRPSSKSAGLGLAICKSIVQLHGGRIFVKSETNKGSIFCFLLPTKKQKKYK